MLESMALCLLFVLSYFKLLFLLTFDNGFWVTALFFVDMAEFFCL